MKKGHCDKYIYVYICVFVLNFNSAILLGSIRTSKLMINANFAGKYKLIINAKVPKRDQTAMSIQEFSRVVCSYGLDAKY